MINKRALIITFLLLFVFIALTARLYIIQISGNEYYSLIAGRQQNKPQTVKAGRGTIADRNGEVLSYTSDNISFFVDTRMIDSQKADSVASLFSGLFGKNKKHYLELIENGFRNVCLEKKVPMEKALQLKKVVIDGLFYEEDFSRVYPYGSLASHLLGYVDKKMTGVDGVEKVYNEKLTGTDGYYVFEKDVLGRIVSVNENESRSPSAGNNITLTINKTYQQILEEELSKGLEKYEGESAVGIIMNPDTGEILALSNSPDFDPANYEIFPDQVRRNRLLTDTYEPGSTMKSISMSILFEQKLAKTDEIIDTENGTYYFKGVKISDTHPHTSLTVREILEQSSNVGMAKLSHRIPDDLFYKFLRDFGFGNPTSIDLPGEASGLLKKPNSFSAVTKPFLSYGYEIAVTPLQMIAAFSSLINGGILYQPYVMKSVSDHNGNIIEETHPVKIRNVISKETSDLIRELMVGVVEQGTGTPAQLDDVVVGGKTGTAQLLIDNSYSRKKHNSSFIGFLPADNPKIVCLILVNAPQVGKYGGLVAAPIFKEVARKIVDADLTLVPEKKLIKRNKSIADKFIADLKTSPVSTSKSYLNISANNRNRTTVRRIFNESRTTMPDLKNRSLRDAIAQLNELGLDYKISGFGKVVEQSIEPGVPFSAGDTCLIKCEPVIKLNNNRIN